MGNVCYNANSSSFHIVGAERSLGGHLPWAQGVTGSNPVAPTNPVFFRDETMVEILRFAQDFGSRLRRRESASSSNPVAPTNTRTKFKREIGVLRSAQDFGSRLRRREGASSSNPVSPTINPMRF